MVIRSLSGVQPNISPDDLPLQRFYLRERTMADRIYLTQPYDGGKIRHYTWAEVGDEVRRMASFLKAQDWPAGSRIGILGKNSAGWIMCDLAIWMAGHVSVPLYPMLTADNIRQIVKHSESVACFVGRLDDRSLADGVPDKLLKIALPFADKPILDKCAVTWGDTVANTHPMTASPTFPGSDLATLVYTSGTTGQAKGVMHSFDTLTAALLTIVGNVGYREDDRMFSYLPLAHIMERSVLELASIYCGAHIFFAESLATFADDLRRARPTLFVSVPRLWLKFQQGVFAKMPQKKLERLWRIPIVRGIVNRKILAGLGLDAVRQCASGSAPLTKELMEWYAKLGLRICEGYGMTEVGCTSHGNRMDDIRFGTVGPPADMVKQRIDPATGEVQVLTPGATLGYYKEPELTADLFTADGWIKTGDKGVISESGHLTLVGRIKDNFKTSKGKYVAPGPIEHKLANHDAVDTCLVAGSSMAQPMGIVVLNELAVKSLPGAKAELEASFADHMQAINATLDPHEHLDCIVLTRTAWTPDNGLLTPTLKVKRPQIEERFGAYFEEWAAARKPVVWLD
jgi:long-chain acyl-CoA synthetase